MAKPPLIQGETLYLKWQRFKMKNELLENLEVSEDFAISSKVFLQIKVIALSIFSDRISARKGPHEKYYIKCQERRV
jgi:hypothetical protein